MICYKDTTFCSSPECQGKCGRQFTEQDKINAEKWWGGKDIPIAWGDFCSKGDNHDSN